MTVALWCALAFAFVACIADMVTVARYHRDLDEVRADQDGHGEQLGDLRADLAETREYLAHLATVVTATEQPSTGRHAHSNEMRNVA